MVVLDKAKSIIEDEQNTHSWLCRKMTQHFFNRTRSYRQPWIKYDLSNRESSICQSPRNLDSTQLALMSLKLNEQKAKFNPSARERRTLREKTFRANGLLPVACHQDHLYCPSWSLNVRKVTAPTSALFSLGSEK